MTDLRTAPVHSDAHAYLTTSTKQPSDTQMGLKGTRADLFAVCLLEEDQTRLIFFGQSYLSCSEQQSDKHLQNMAEDGSSLRNRFAPQTNSHYRNGCKLVSWGHQIRDATPDVFALFLGGRGFCLCVKLQLGVIHLWVLVKGSLLRGFSDLCSLKYDESACGRVLWSHKYCHGSRQILI